ncbi:MAG: hypothetical protein COA79_16370 [Planctomycetota bacterium]|nr:MAG: hypothetical protein COA79_16370 [Planctomycetota bacterium]
MKSKIFLMLSIFYCATIILYAKEQAALSKPGADFLKGLAFSIQILHATPMDQKYEKEIKRIRKIGYRILTQTSDSRPITFHILKDPSVNAFALPGGFIFITEGMIKLKLDDDEMAHLLGHEIAHVVKDHHSKMTTKLTKATILNSLFSVALQFATIYNAGKDNKNTYTKDARESRQKEIYSGLKAAYTLPQISQILYALKYTRALETEADSYGKMYVTKVGYSPNGASKLFKRLSKTDNNKIGNIWRSHPKMLDRTAKAIISEPHKPIVLKQETILILKTRIQKNLLSIIEYFFILQKNELAKKKKMNLAKVGSTYFKIIYLAKMIQDINSDSSEAKKAREIIYQEELLKSSFSRSKIDWGKLYTLFKSKEPSHELLPQIAIEAKKQKSDLLLSIENKNAGIPIIKSFIKNFPQYPSISKIYELLIQSYIINKNYSRIPDYFFIALEKNKSGDNKKLSRLTARYIPHCKKPYQLYLMVTALKNKTITEKAIKQYEKIITKSNDLQEIYLIINENKSLKLKKDKNEYIKDTVKKLYTKAKLFEVQDKKGDALKIYSQILTYGKISPLYKEVQISFQTLEFR